MSARSHTSTTAMLEWLAEEEEEEHAADHALVDERGLAATANGPHTGAADATALAEVRVVVEAEADADAVEMAVLG